MADLIRPTDNPEEAAMTDSARPVCDCPEPCACYAEGYVQGKEEAHFEIRASWTPTTVRAAVANLAGQSAR